MKSFRVGPHFAHSGPLAEWPSSVSISKYFVHAPRDLSITSGDRGREELVDPRQHVEHLRANLAEVARRRTSPKLRRVTSELGSNWRAHPSASSRGAAMVKIGDRARSTRSDHGARAFDAHLEHGREDAAAVVVPAAVPVRVGSESWSVFTSVPPEPFGADTTTTAPFMKVGRHGPLERVDSRRTTAPRRRRSAGPDPSSKVFWRRPYRAE